MRTRKKYHRLKNHQIWGFTIMEILLMVVIISVSLVAIIVTLNNGMWFIQKTRERTIAINLAREGVEAVYQIRDTNRHRRAGKKEECRLKVDPLVDEGNNGCGNDDKRMKTGNYILINKTLSGQQYFTLSGGSRPELDLSDGMTTWVDDKYSLCEGTGNIRNACPWQEPDSKEWIYFRQIQWIGLFLKDAQEIWGTLLDCTEWSDAWCGTEAPKEYRFCSQVTYIGRWEGTVELCSTLTNFQKK